MGDTQKKDWLGGSVKRPGKLTAEAESSGRTKLRQSDHDAKSGDPQAHSRGALGVRLIKKSL